MNFRGHAVRGLVAIVTASLLLLALAGIQIARADHVPVHGTILARGPFVDPVNLKMQAVVAGELSSVKVRGAADTIVQQVTVQPGGFTGWHSHPGPATVVVAQGEFTYYDGEDPTCTGYPYGPGESFVDLGRGHVHSARNEGSDVVVVYVTYFDVPPSVTSPFIPAADPGVCPF
ncbi:MAG TPA: cupin domain-containing protein [Actinomycetota bacterium]|nr:cupin domain-containing protein [Actinomycetota bacterium]